MDKEHTFQSPTIAQRCAKANKLDWDKIDTCYQGKEGHELELGYYNQTASLQPPHRYTPWITINGEVCMFNKYAMTLKVLVVQITDIKL